MNNVPVPTRKEIVGGEFYRSKFIDILSIIYNKLLERYGYLKEEEVEVTEAILDDLSNTIKNNGATPVFIYLPNFREIYFYKQELSMEESFFWGYCRTRRLYCKSMTKDIQDNIDEGEDLWVGGHYSPRVNEIVATSIKDFLVEESIVVEGSGDAIHPG